jgi:hypothetical protein
MGWRGLKLDKEVHSSRPKRRRSCRMPPNESDRSELCSKIAVGCEGDRPKFRFSVKFHEERTLKVEGVDVVFTEDHRCSQNNFASINLKHT